MMLMSDMRPAWPTMWTSRAALFGAGVVLTTLAMHRLFWMPTPVALNLLKAGFAFAALAVLLALAAFASIWRTGSPGVARVLFGLAVSLTLLCWPASLLPAISALPAINDVSTDTNSPPPFPTLAKVRIDSHANPPIYPGSAFAEAQAKAYPDIVPLLIDRPVDEIYEIVVATLQRMKLRIVHEELPNPRAGQPGLVEATDRTLILGFLDDVVMRVSGDQRRARVDIRSASRYGQHDLGRNALRVRTIFKELAARIEATVPVPAEGQRVSAVTQQRDIKNKVAKLLPKRPKERDPTIIAPQPLPDPARADAPRAPAQKVKPRRPGEYQVRDKRPRQSSE